MDKYLTAEPNKYNGADIRFDEMQAAKDGAVRYAPAGGINPVLFHIERNGDKFVMDDDDFSQFDTLEAAIEAGKKAAVAYITTNIPR